MVGLEKKVKAELHSFPSAATNDRMHAVDDVLPWVVCDENDVASGLNQNLQI